MATQYAKIKSPPKVVVTQKHNLNSTIAKTMETISDIVGATLGPGGKSVIIERQEIGLPNIITKDGVTVFKSLGFINPTEHAIMEAARDAASKTAHDAGDGTTTATILAEAIVRKTMEFTDKNPKISPQKAVRALQACFKGHIEPLVKKTSLKPTQQMLKAVATISGNGDTDLAHAVMECFKLVGDDGNVTITEQSGPSEYRVEHINGFPIPKGYDESLGRFYPAFINDKPNQRVHLEKPLFILHFGSINDVYCLGRVTEIIMESWQRHNTSPHVVIVATGFSEQVVGALAANFNTNGLKVVPLVVPMFPVANGQKDFLDDLQAVTGAVVFDPLTNPLPNRDVNELDMSVFGSGVTSFEMNRTRSNIVGFADEALILERSDEIKAQIEAANSILDKSILEERYGKITGGIAKLTVIGSSYGEIRERKDRADDAVRAVQGSMKHGCLPAGGWGLAKIITHLSNPANKCLDPDGVVLNVLIPALSEPISRLYRNVGLNTEESAEIQQTLLLGASKDTKTASTYDCLGMTWVSAKESGLLDSTPAVLEAIRNSLSIASLLGTLGGCVVYHRDIELERREAQETNTFLRDSDAKLDNPY